MNSYQPKQVPNRLAERYFQFSQQKNQTVHRDPCGVFEVEMTRQPGTFLRFFPDFEQNGRSVMIPTTVPLSAPGASLGI